MSYVNNKVYKLRPVIWTGKCDEPWERVEADIPFGSYSIFKDDDGQCKWSYSYSEYYDEDSGNCESIEDGKAKCIAHWIERMETSLVVVMQSPNTPANG